MMNTDNKHFRRLLSVLLWLSFIASIVISFFIFYYPQTTIFGLVFTNPVYNFVQGIPSWLYFFIHFTLFSIISSVVFIGLSLYFNIQRDKNAKLRARYFSYFTFILASYFSKEIYKNSENKEKYLRKIRPFVKRKVQLTAFLDSYLRLQEIIAENLSEDFKLMVVELGLQRKIESFIHSNNFDDVILMMRVLSYLRIQKGIEKIEQLAKSKNFVIRTEAYAALIRLMENNKFIVDFIGEKHKLSILDINIIVNAILKNRKDNIDFKALLTSSNVRKVKLGLLLFKYRGVKSQDNILLIAQYLGSPNLLFNKLAWNSYLVSVPEEVAVDTIIEKYEEETDEIKLLILQNSHNILTERFYTFIEKAINRECLLVKIEAMKIIHKNKFDMLSLFANSEDREIKMAYNETMCLHINK